MLTLFDYHHNGNNVLKRLSMCQIKISILAKYKLKKEETL